MNALSPSSSFASTQPSTLSSHAPPSTSTPSSSLTNSTPAQAQAKPLPGDGDLWSSILDSVKGAGKGAEGGPAGVGGGGVGGTRQCVVLGAPHSGKSTLLARLRSSTGEIPSSSALNGAGHGEGEGEGGDGRKHLDLGMSYEVLDVRDEGDEGETLARLSLFHLSDSSSPSPSTPPQSTHSSSSSSSLLSLALNRSTLLSTLILIVLDWEKPWKWVEELEGWIAVLEERVRGVRIEGGGAGREVWEEVEGRERLEAFIRAYHEPPAASSSSSAPTTVSTSTAAYDPDAPLPPGTLTDNLGVGIVVVCTKADQMNVLEREREFTDEQFDYIQQTLRTIALRYGAALFYTSQTSPPSYSKLRQYILHRLLSTPSTTTSLLSTTTTTSSTLPTSPTSPSAAPPALPSRPLPPTTTSTAFPFPHRANVVDRDAVLVPSGWDSWGKIRVLRERFDAGGAGEGWERDMERRRVGDMAEGEGAGEADGLRKEYEMVVVDFDAEDEPIKLSSTVTPLDEQTFLKAHFETLQADAAKDPRLAFRQQPSSSSSTTNPITGSSSTSPALGGLASSVVGPMAGATLELPTVVSTLERARGEKADEMGRRSTRSEAGDAFGARGMSRQNSQTGATTARSPPLDGSSPAAGVPAPSSSRHSPSLSASLLQRSSSQTSSTATGSPALPSTAGAAAGGNQVLADFFQSLLTARGAGGGATGGGAGAGASAGGAAGGGELGASTNRRPSELREGGK